ncbi:hypothetical protein PASE110613_13650 [Paenibacillus sediminis]|uniref:Uncharacterized protein n=1 Tax=Paenibacillus sediminis TaxID=664909 RepID=A0ABS4H3W2_9BACL|nr:hypothetical protein [Paenibacillus sediminis]MBP1937220.1 hypothetical protein [Paenibacillus sediminis]
MQIEVLKDIIRDERGNYYVAVHSEGKELTLVNAFVEASYDIILKFDDEFKEKYREYEGSFIGKIPMDNLRHDYVFALKDEGYGRVYDLKEVSEHYKVTFIDMIEFYRNPKWKK